MNIYDFQTPGGEGGIRTPGTSRYDGFQDRCDRPLCHFSAANVHFFCNVQYLAAFFLENFSKSTRIILEK